MTHNQRRSKGITFVEVLIASVAFTIVALGSVSMFAVARRQVQVELRRRQAIQLAARGLEELKAGEYDSILIGTDPNTMTVGNIKFNTEAVATLDGSGLYKHVVMTVGWNQFGHAHQVALPTIIAP